MKYASKKRGRGGESICDGVEGVSFSVEYREHETRSIIGTLEDLLTPRFSFPFLDTMVALFADAVPPTTQK